MSPWPIVVVPLIAAAAWRARAVDGSGAIAGLLVGTAIAVGAGWGGLAMLATLLVLGTALSQRHHRRRDALQVFSNGGVAAIAALACEWGVPGCGHAVAGALGAALSDTLSGELGARLGGRPRAMLLGPPMATGADGGMSILGTLVGVAGAFAVPAVGALLGTVPWGGVAWISLAGMAGNLADSLLGLLVQRHLGTRGNDWTNLVATACGAAIALA